MQTEYKGYNIWSEYVGEKNANWDEFSADRHHKIHIKKGDEHISFNFWTSRAQPEIEDERDLLYAVECFFSDADFGDYDFEDYCREMGYDVPKGFIQSWKDCQKANAKVTRMFGSDWQDFANELREEIN